MSQTDYKTIDELVERITSSGCRVTIPYSEPSPLTVMFDGDFSGAEFIQSYPATLHIFGTSGHVAISCVKSIDKICGDKYAVNFGDESYTNDMMVRILD